MMINQVDSPTKAQVSAFSQLSGESGKMCMQLDIRVENISSLDQARIIERYRKRQSQHGWLATINMSEDMKRKLFGFSEGYYLTNDITAKDLIVEDHPLRGKVIYTRKKYEHYLNEKEKEEEIRSDRLSRNPISKINSEQAELTSNLQINLGRHFRGLQDSVEYSDTSLNYRRKTK